MEQQHKTYKHFIFDFDGVICDSLPFAIEEFNRLGNEYFPSLPSIRRQEDMTIVYSGSLRRCLHAWLSERDSRRFFDLHSAAMAARMNDLRLFKGIAEVLSSLGQGSVSIVTSAYSRSVREILKKDQHFDEHCLYEIAGREFRQSKTQKINNILSRLELSPHEAVYVGDLESDILYCSDVPIDIIAVGYGYHPYDYLVNKHPTYCVRSVQELHELFAESSTLGDSCH